MMFRTTWINTVASNFIGCEKTHNFLYRMLVLDIEPRGSRLAVDRKFLRAWVKSAEKLQNDMIRFKLVSLGNEPELPKKFRSLIVKNSTLLTEEIRE